MVQLDSRTDKEGFTAAELDLLAALAVPMGIAVENHSLLKSERHGRRPVRSSARYCRNDRPDIAGYTFWECYRPVEEVGGDLYDYIPVGSSATRRGRRAAGRSCSATLPARECRPL